MKIFYDGYIFRDQFAGGINRYFANIISRLPADYSPILTTNHYRNLNFPVHSKLKTYKYNRFRPIRISNLLETFYFKSLLNFKTFDLFHPTYYNLLTNSTISNFRKPVVITVWDMIHELFPSFMDPYGNQIEQKRKAILGADAVICISENTKKDLLNLYSIPEEKVTVTYLASELNEKDSYGYEKVPDKPYFLFVGSRTSSYKNFKSVLEALAQSKKHDSKIHLCVVGGPPFNSQEQNYISDLGLVKNIQHYGFVSDKHLAKLYRCSQALIYPSLYEGFGLPLIEAMSCGTPVIACNSSSIPEVVGDAGLLFEPGATDQFSCHLVTLLDNSSAREVLISKGKERAKLFNWDITAIQTINVYRSLTELNKAL